MPWIRYCALNKVLFQTMSSQMYHVYFYKQGRRYMDEYNLRVKLFFLYDYTLLEKKTISWSILAMKVSRPVAIDPHFSDHQKPDIRVDRSKSIPEKTRVGHHRRHLIIMGQSHNMLRCLNNNKKKNRRERRKLNK